MIAEQLKRSVLQAAIQGKLTQQLQEDGEALNLLKDVRKEKARLFSEGKIKKEKALPMIIENEIPFDLPNNWRWVRLGEIINLKSGHDMTPDKYSNLVPGIPYITGASNFSNGVITVDRWTKTPEAMANKGELLITCKGTVGEMAFLREEKAHIARQVMAIEVIGTLNSEFLHFFLKWQVNELNKMAKSMIPGITRDMVLHLLIPIPPAKEQNRIVKRLKEILPELDQLKETEYTLDNIQRSFPKKIRASILQYAVEGKLTEQLPSDGDARDLLKEIQQEKDQLVKEGKIRKDKPLSEITQEEMPFDIPENWQWSRIGEIFTLQAGKFASADSIRSEGKYPCYGGNGLRGYVDSFNREGRFPLIGRQGALCGNINIADGKFHATEHAVVVEYYCNCNPDWAAIFLRALNLNQYSTATAQPGLAVSKINLVPFPVPPIAEQNRIVERLEKLLPEIDQLKIN